VRHRTDLPRVREWAEQQLAALEVLNGTLMGLSRLSGAERAKVSSPSRLGILLAGIQPVLSGLQFSNQWDASRQVAVTTTPFGVVTPNRKSKSRRLIAAASAYAETRPRGGYATTA